jgi:hypothetical protein
VRDCVFRSVYSARNAAYQVMAMTIGSDIATLSPGETMLAGQISSKTTGLTRSWEYWSMRVAKSGGLAAAPERKSNQKRRAAPAKKSRPKRSRKKRR